MGDPKANTPMYDVGGITVFGGTYPARIWHDYTEAALLGQPAIPFPAPDPSAVPPSKYIPAPDDRQGAGGTATPSTTSPFLAPAVPRRRSATTGTVPSVTTPTAPSGSSPTVPPTSVATPGTR
jgi:hypothetical protein